MDETKETDAYEEELLDYEEEDEKVPHSVNAKANGESAKKGYVGIHSSGFRDFLLKPELLRAIVDSGFEHPSEGEDWLNIFLHEGAALRIGGVIGSYGKFMLAAGEDWLRWILASAVAFQVKSIARHSARQHFLSAEGDLGCSCLPLYEFIWNLASSGAFRLRP